jgi:hypothetical protein
MSDQFVYASPLDPRAKPLIEDLTYEYDSRYGDFFDAEGAIVEMNRYPPEAFARSLQKGADLILWGLAQRG